MGSPLFLSLLGSQVKNPGLEDPPSLGYGAAGPGFDYPL